MAHVSDLISTDIEKYLKQHENKSLLRFITCGSVDDGKSTVIGRLLYESKMLFEDQLAAMENDSKKWGTQGGDLDFALLVDGLAAEREQGITIDVAYRFFSTDRRKFIVADTPGHEQYTRNMITGASTADVAVILIDARKGVLTQTRRHSYLVSLIGIRKVVLAINKMDLVDFSEDVFRRIDEVPRVRQADRPDRHHQHPAVRSEGRQHDRAQPAHDLVPRADADGLPRDLRDRRDPPAAAALPHAGAVGQPPQPGLPRLLRLHRQRRGQARRPGARPALGPREQGRPHRLAGR
jgi:small GTP-binding protein